MNMKKIALLAGGKLELQNPEDTIVLQDGMVKVHVSACGICSMVSTQPIP